MRTARREPPAEHPRAACTFQRKFTRENIHPYDEIEWQYRTAYITNDRGETIFEQENIEVPKFWSENATNIVASKYFCGAPGMPGREQSVKRLIDRVVNTTVKWGVAGGYLQDATEATIFKDELTYILLHQIASFNSPVWFNLGVEAKPQISACFINSVEDSMESILELVKTEGLLFKYGSGTGTNLSPIRSSRERIAGGGYASGPVSFMKGYDAFASVIKSGGKTRRAAKMQILNVDHPDVVDFIECKANEERKAWSLIDAGYDGSIGGEAYDSVFFQNANLSVRVNDAFMRAAEDDAEWKTLAVTSGKPIETYQARDIMQRMARAAHQCGDPGLQFDDTVNKWNPCLDTARINSSNPCSEFMFLDDTACNLASLNLLKFIDDSGTFDVEAFEHCVHVMTTAMEIFVGSARYPTPKITEKSFLYRPLGLGYTNLGALLMAKCLPYDSDVGRAYAGTITALMTGQAYKTSALIASRIGPFDRFPQNKGSFLRVINQHAEALKDVDSSFVPSELYESATQTWKEAAELGAKHGFRNAQTSVLAPTGTISFMMDCDTTGIEPDIALIKYKRLVGGGFMKIANRTVPKALSRLGYSEDQVKDILDHLLKQETIEGAPHLREEDLPVFDCAFRPKNGQRFIHYSGHVRMMAAVQPFISGAISKTVNLQESATAEEVEEVFKQAWKLGLKAIAIYRDGCKRTQPLSTTAGGKKEKKEVVYKPVRRRLPDERQSITHKFNVGGAEGYITVGKYPDGGPGEIFVTMAKQGSTISGLVDTVATLTSIALQYGVPLNVLVKKFTNMRFEPAGFTNNKAIPMARSIVDYIFRWLGTKFMTPEERASNGQIDHVVEDAQEPEEEGEEAVANEPAPAPKVEDSTSAFEREADSPVCFECGSLMVRAGACYQCLNCGLSNGCS
jgi:ribonucleoside-diphosphate reductase alpha chain